MDTYYKESTVKSPEIKLDYYSGSIEITGRSILENSVVFFNDTVQWIKGYSLSPKEVTDVTLKLEYINTSALGVVSEILENLGQLHRENKTELKINWYYEKDDIDMKAIGEDFAKLLEVEVNFVDTL